MLKKFIFILSLLVGLGYGHGFSQDPNPKIRTLKIEVVTAKMNMSPEQTKRFLPLYNQYSDELLAVYREKRELNKNKNSMYAINQRQKLDQDIVDIKGKYKNDFLKIITAEQLSQMYQAEEEFKNMLIERLKTNKKK